MQIEHIEQWVGREVVDSEGASVGKLEEVYFRGDDAVLAEVKTGMLARKRLLVPLAGTTVTRDEVRLDFREDALLEESKGGQGFRAEDLTAVAEHYGAAHRYDTNELESSRARTDRLAELGEEQDRVRELELEAERREQAATSARERAAQAQRDAEQADADHRSALEKARTARAALDSRWEDRPHAD